jgi:hypothetical protein
MNGTDSLADMFYIPVFLVNKLWTMWFMPFLYMSGFINAGFKKDFVVSFTGAKLRNSPVLRN